MTAPVIGMQFSRPQDEPVPVIGADFSKMWLIESSTGADAAVFPLGEPVRFSSSDKAYTSKLGTGPLADAVRGINSQLTGVNRGADITVTRVAESALANVTDARAQTSANIAAALRDAAAVPSEVNGTPRLVWAGRTGWRPDTDTSNPIVAEMDEALGKLLAVAVVDVDDTSTALAIDARETMNSQRIMPIGVAGRVYEGTSIVTRPMGPRILGLIARIDNENEGKPFDPFANRALYGLAGLSRKIPFSFLEGSTEGQQLLDADVSIVVAGEVNVDGAVADGGFTFLGTDNVDGTGELWKQIHQVRGADYITVKLMQITRQSLGRKTEVDMVEAWINSMAFMLRDHKADNDILGYSPKSKMFTAASNSPENIRLGNLKVELGIEPAPVFKRGDHEVRRYRPAVEGLVSDILARLTAVS